MATRRESVVGAASAGRAVQSVGGGAAMNDWAGNAAGAAVTTQRADRRRRLRGGNALPMTTACGGDRTGQTQRGKRHLSSTRPFCPCSSSSRRSSSLAPRTSFGSACSGPSQLSSPRCSYRRPCSPSACTSACMSRGTRRTTFCRPRPAASEHRRTWSCPARTGVQTAPCHTVEKRTQTANCNDERVLHTNCSSDVAAGVRPPIGGICALRG